MPDPTVALIAGGSSLLGGVLQFRAAEKAAQAGADAAGTATRAQLEMYYQSREDMAPWREAGVNALNTLTGMLEQGPGEYEKSPYYDFLMGEGTQALEQGASARGGLLSGAESKALTKYGQNVASTDYGTWLNNWYKSLTPYQSMAGLGQTSAGQTAQNAIATGQMIGQNYQAAGNALATGYINQGNIYGNAISGLGQNALNYYMYNRPSYSNVSTIRGGQGGGYGF